MSTITRTCFTVLGLITLAACASPWIKAGEHSVAGLNLRTPVGWTAQSQNGRHLWTRDGVLLNALHIVVDLAPSQPVFGVGKTVAKNEGTRFRAGMGPIEIQELIVEAMAAAGMRNVKTIETQPARLQGRAGIRSELSLDSSTGLRYRAILLAEGEDNSLSLLLFVATAEFYFERDRALIEGIFESAAK